MIENRKKRQILTFDKLAPATIWHFCIMNVKKCNEILVLVSIYDCSSTNPLISHAINGIKLSKLRHTKTQA